MNKVIGKILLTLVELLLTGIFLLSGFAVINIMVSQKYEANDGCISAVTGTNLCLFKVLWGGLAVFSVVLMIVAWELYKRKRKGKRK